MRNAFFAPLARPAELVDGAAPADGPNAAPSTSSAGRASGAKKALRVWRACPQSHWPMRRSFSNAWAA
eukprot:9959011-Lingulodinium_polyedra.AAC.1